MSLQNLQVFEKAGSTLAPPAHILAFIPAARYQLNGFFFLVCTLICTKWY